MYSLLFFSFHKPDDDYINDPFLLTFRSWHDICFTNASTHVFPMIWYILMLIYMDFFSSNLHCNPKMCTLFSWCEFVFLKTPTFYLGPPSPTRPAPPTCISTRLLFGTSEYNFDPKIKSSQSIKVNDNKYEIKKYAIKSPFLCLRMKCIFLLT